MREVIFRDDQKIVTSDLNNLSAFRRQAIDVVVSRAITDLRYFTGFTVTKTGQTEITVTAGHYWGGGPVYAKDDPTVFNLLTGGAYMPVVTRRKIAIVVYGETIETDVQERSFVIDDQGNTEPQSVAMERLRAARVALVAGAESPDPQKPILDVGVIPVAWITLTTSGVLDGSIEVAEDYRLPSVESLKQKVAEIESWRAIIGQAVDTILTDLARIQALIPPDRLDFMLAMLARIEELENLIKVPGAPASAALQVFVDRFQSLRDSDTEYAGYSARVEGGLTFAGGTPDYSAVALNNPLDPRVTVVNDILTPKIGTAKPRVQITGADAQLSISQYTSQTTERVQKTASRTVTVYSRAFSVAYLGYSKFDGANALAISRAYDGSVPVGDASAWLAKLYEQITVQDNGSGVTQRFKFRGPDGQELDVEFTPGSSSAAGDYYRVLVKGGATQQVVTESYWDTVTRDATVTGSQVAQTFLNATNGLLTEVEIEFGQIAASGDVKVYITEVESDRPVLDTVISRGTIAVANLVGNAKNKCTIEPVQLQGGRRYAVVLVSTGNHFVGVRTGNKYVSGSAFYLSDTGEWLPVQNSGDICMSLNFPQFDATRVEVLMEPLTRSGGIDEIRINAACVVPQGTKLLWEVQRAGKWYQISEGEYGALTGSPTLVNLRAVFVGTRDLMPSVDLSQTEIEITGLDDTFTHISELHELDAATEEVRVDYYIRGYDADEHEVDCDLIIPGSPDTIVAPDSLVVEPDPLDETTVKVTAVFTPSSTSSYRVKTTGDRGESDGAFVITERRDAAFGA